MENQMLTLHDAAKRILEEKNIHIEDADVLGQMIEDIIESISNRINVGMVNALGQAKQVELDMLINQQATPEQIQEFFAANVHNIPDIVTQSILDVRNQYLSQ
jgi:hypothetical protein